jgi:hypothetical protein
LFKNKSNIVFCLGAIVHIEKCNKLAKEKAKVKDGSRRVALKFDITAVIPESKDIDVSTLWATDFAKLTNKDPVVRGMFEYILAYDSISPTGQNHENDFWNLQKFPLMSCDLTVLNNVNSVYGRGILELRLNELDYDENRLDNAKRFLKLAAIDLGHSKASYRLAYLLVFPVDQVPTKDDINLAITILESAAAKHHTKSCILLADTLLKYKYNTIHVSLQNQMYQKVMGLFRTAEKQGSKKAVKRITEQLTSLKSKRSGSPNMQSPNSIDMGEIY